MFLSGTSMATPHVSGVAAGLLAAHSTLSPAQARDIILDPASYKPMTDTRAQSTSSGGRLDYNLTLKNPRLNAPIVLNNFPTLVMGPDVMLNAGQLITLTPTVTDPDPGDQAGLRKAFGKSVSTATQWLLGWNLNLSFPNGNGMPAPSLSRVATVPYYAGVADNRGRGSKRGQQRDRQSGLHQDLSPAVRNIVRVESGASDSSQHNHGEYSSDGSERTHSLLGSLVRRHERFERLVLLQRTGDQSNL
jgi:hypothetical protein